MNTFISMSAWSPVALLVLSLGMQALGALVCWVVADAVQTSGSATLEISRPVPFPPSWRTGTRRLATPRPDRVVAASAMIERNAA